MKCNEMATKLITEYGMLPWQIQHNFLKNAKEVYSN